MASPHRDEAGGLSGKPLFNRSTVILARMRQLVGNDLPIIGVGGIHSADSAWEKLRAGANLSSNPIPEAFVNPLFPATVEDHYTLGLGYKLSGAGEINASLTMAPKVTVTNGQGVTISHGQTNVQLMYSHRF